MLIFYVDETGTASLATVPDSSPPELAPGTAKFFTLAAVGLAYLGSIPLSMLSQRRLIAKLAAQQAAPAADNVERLDRTARP